jgi:tetratricopeptide (TPR) repeat protein
LFNGFFVKEVAMETLQFINKGDDQIMVGKPEEAMTFYSAALSLDKNCFEAWLGMGLALNTMYRYEEALPCYERALTLNRHSITAECMVEYLREKVKTYREH